MNIGQMMRGLLGDATSGESRAMELKVGQIVRGVVLQALDNNEAIVNINGVHVRAKLEMALQPGQSAMLQVQPESDGSLVLLKAVDLSASGLLDDTFRDYAKLLGLPDQKWALAIIKSLRQDGFAINRTTAAVFQQAATVMPKGADAEQWMTAAATAFKRGLPVTQETIASMRQVMFGKPAHELLDTLRAQLTGMGSSGAADGNQEGAGQTSSRLLGLLQQGASLLDEAITTPQSARAGEVSQSRTDSVHSDETTSGRSRTDSARSQAAGVDEPAQSPIAKGGDVRIAATPANWLGQMMKWLGVDHELQLAKAATEATNPPLSGEPQTKSSDRTATVSGLSVQAETSATAKLAASPASVQQQGTASVSLSPAQTSKLTANGSLGDADMPSTADGAEGFVAPVKPDQQQGAGATVKVLGAIAQDGPAGQDLAQPGQGTGLASGPGQAGGGMQQESLKSALMSLVNGSDALPPQVKETAQQLIHQITGQQLLLSPERNNSVFTHVTMFIPLKDASGEQTASVQIQTRRGRRGELDADNCRLLFNLSMRSLGDMLVDVQVTDKIVSLNLWNDHPAIAGLIEGSREEMSARLSQMGYQLLSMRTKPMPKGDGEYQSDASSATNKTKQSSPPSSALLTAARYKGVDYRA
ncbi:flagellar hook-length control protein FliK [Paenibacillus sp. LHD-117]|uniref:flagellar hook-length control protein FliK n=1 Tax=Paenibacillus sp. LHD-117 TaxID=3071412 RepID=UPI0027E1463A|nr:flagellar hook-length control protein FliK [Paenibacillus sp. LHD-117]MDQ6419276.1 flagellar hook-length control protein FliK [Paenibacillus sp. LHD-117]